MMCILPECGQYEFDFYYCTTNLMKLQYRFKMYLQNFQFGSIILNRISIYTDPLMKGENTDGKVI